VTDPVTPFQFLLGLSFIDYFGSPSRFRRTHFQAREDEKKDGLKKKILQRQSNFHIG